MIAVRGIKLCFYKRFSTSEYFKINSCSSWSKIKKPSLWIFNYDSSVAFALTLILCFSCDSSLMWKERWKVSVYQYLSSNYIDKTSLFFNSKRLSFFLGTIVFQHEIYYKSCKKKQNKSNQICLGHKSHIVFNNM